MEQCHHGVCEGDPRLGGDVMPNHCRCCSGKFLENDVLGDCPGCPGCAEKEAEIATLTAEIESYRVRGWEKSRYPSLAEELRAERDDYKAHFEVCDANRQQVVAERDAALATIAALRVAAGAVCGFPSPKAWERLEEVLEKCSPQTK